MGLDQMPFLQLIKYFKSFYSLYLILAQKVIVYIIHVAHHGVGPTEAFVARLQTAKAWVFVNAAQGASARCDVPHHHCAKWIIGQDLLIGDEYTTSFHTACCPLDQCIRVPHIKVDENAL